MRTAMAAAVIISSLALCACSGDDSTSPSSGVGGAPGPAATSSGSVGATGESQLPAPDEMVGSVAPTPSPEASADTFAVVVVPETGVPGLDSDDTFCAAWSRFGGSWQVIQVAANFAPDPSVVPVMEVAAAPVVVDAYAAMFDAWPAELDEERDVVADGYFGPLHRRAEAALDALGRVGATDQQVAALGDAWIDALATRRSDDPTVTLVVDDELRSVADAAAAELLAERVDFLDDPSMRITVVTPLTDGYLATACPDQGALTGAEVDGG